MARNWIPRRQLAIALAIVATAAACSTPDAPPEPNDPTPKASSAPKSVDELERGDQPVLPVKLLPDGWKRVPPEDRLEGNPGKPVYCGVEVEPAETSEGRVAYYEAPDVPSSVIQFAMVATPETATKSLDALLATHDKCVDPGFVVKPVPAKAFDGVGDQHVSWDFTSENDDSVKFRALVFRRDEVVITLVASGVTSVPTSEQLEIARTIDERLQKG